MTIDKNSKVIIPVWLVSILVSIVVAGFTTWGIVSASTATFEERTLRNAVDIQFLDKEKVDKEVFQVVLKRLDDVVTNQESMNKKLDNYINR